MKQILKDIFNYFFILKQIKKMKLMPEWHELNLRNQLANIYTVRTVHKDILGEQNFNIRKEKIHEYFEPVFDWLLYWNLQDVLIPDPIIQVKDSNSFLLVLRPNPKVLTINYMLALLTITLISILLIKIIF